jgi:hypothetical protein
VATTNKIIVHGASTTYYTVGSNVNAACINQAGTESNVISMMGGSGLGTNFAHLDIQSIDALVSNAGTFAVQNTAAIPAGTNNIGEVSIDAAQLADARSTAGVMADTFQLVDIPTDGTAAQLPVAIAHGTNPTAVAAAAKVIPLANRAGIPFMIGGHPNVITKSATIDDADGAQTDASLLTIAGGSKIVVTALSAICASSNSGAVAVRIGFGAATLGAASEAGTAGILLEGKYAASGGNQKGNGAGILGIGGDGEDLRITCDDPAGGSLFVTFSYYTIES